MILDFGFKITLLIAVFCFSKIKYQQSNIKNHFMVIKRKEFLQIGSLATASFMLPKFLKAFEKSNDGTIR